MRCWRCTHDSFSSHVMKKILKLVERWKSVHIFDSFLFCISSSASKRGSCRGACRRHVDHFVSTNFSLECAKLVGLVRTENESEQKKMFLSPHTQPNRKKVNLHGWWKQPVQQRWKQAFCFWFLSWKTNRFAMTVEIFHASCQQSTLTSTSATCERQVSL